MKWPLWKSGFQRWERECLKEPSWVRTQIAHHVALPQHRSISSPLLISKAHYFVLRLAACQSSRVPPAAPPWPFTRPIIYFGEFLRYCFVRANQDWVTNDPGRVVGSSIHKWHTWPNSFLKVLCQLPLSLTEGSEDGGVGRVEVKGNWWPTWLCLRDEVTTLTTVPGPELDMTLSLIGALN